MRKPEIYVETSVWSYAFAEDAPESRRATLDFIDLARRGGCELFISEIVLGEISRAAASLAGKLQELIEDLSPVLLEFDEEADRMAQQFIELGAVPLAKIEDAQHVGVAVVGEMDIMVSWNYRHLVNVRRREAIHHVSALNGYYKALHIITPPEVNDEGE